MIATAWSAGDTALVALVAVLLVVSGFLAAAETSLVRVSKSRARVLSEEGRRGSRALASLVTSPERFLNPVLLLVLVCQLTSATLVGVVAGHLFGPAGVIVATVCEVVVIFVLFEAIPKNFAVAHPDVTALVSAPLVAGLLRVAPVRWLATGLQGLAGAVLRLMGAPPGPARVTESEVLALADVAHEDAAIASDERAFIHSVIEFGDTIVREVMVPRPDFVDVEATASVAAALEVAVESGRSRLPVLGTGVDDVVGIVHLRQLAALVVAGRGDEPVGAHASEVHFVPETQRVASLLTQMRRTRGHLVIVVDEYGGTAGLVTLEDVLEELVGEITDESDPHQQVVAHTTGTGLTLSGRLNIDDANVDYNLDLPKDGWDTVGGLVLDLAGGVPEIGEEFAVPGYRLTVLRVEGRRVADVLVEPDEAS